MKHNIPNQVNLSDEEITQIENWNVEHDKMCPVLNRKVDKYESSYGAIGGGRTYCFTPTSIGTIITVECACGEELVVDNDL